MWEGAGKRANVGPAPTLLPAMTDARTLLRALRTTTERISHPLATYTASGQLKCIACDSIIKQTSQWGGHVGSKKHRVCVGKMKELEREKEEKEERERGKRKAEEVEESEEDVVVGDNKKRKIDEGDGGGFPDDFFSDPSLAPPLPTPAPAEEPTKSAIDLEFEAFQRELAATEEEAEETKHDVYSYATTFSEPSLVPSSTFPSSTSMPSASLPSSTPAAEPTAAETRKEDQLKRKEKELEERELIMDRLLDEERAQEEADEKVRVLKKRVESMKLRRAGKGERGGTGD